jgi:hypothetical protein
MEPHTKNVKKQHLPYSLIIKVNVVLNVVSSCQGTLMFWTRQTNTHVGTFMVFE